MYVTGVTIPIGTGMAFTVIKAVLELAAQTLIGVTVKVLVFTTDPVRLIIGVTVPTLEPVRV